MPMQALGAPPPDLRQTGDYRSYPPKEPPRRPRRGGGLGADRSRLVDWTLKGLGLVGVALVSGFLWYLIRNNPAQPNQPQTSPPSSTQGVYNFQAYAGPTTVTDCAAHSTDRVRTYLAAHPCVDMRRTLFTASLPDGSKVITSVAAVQMRTAAAAQGLKAESDATNSGHIKDLVEDGTVIPSGPTSLKDGGYFAEAKGSRMILVMTEYVNASQDTTANLNASNTTLNGVSQDAAKQGVGQPG
jgi:hypothetical protein